MPVSRQRRLPRTKSMLLPLNEVMRNRISIANHLALEMARRGTVEPFHAIVIDEAIFFVRAMSGQNNGTDLRPLLADAIAAFERCRDAVTDLGVFRADDTAYVLFGKVMNAFDEMMRAMPLSAFMDAERRLALLKMIAPD